MRKGSHGRVVAVSIRFIDHVCQRYPTVGDWFWRHTTLHIRVSNMNNDSYNMLVAVHEYIEALLCWQANIQEQSVTKFDMQFEDERNQGMHSPTAEPGDSMAAPYYQQHQIATRVEKFLCQELGIDWEKYDDAVNSL